MITSIVSFVAGAAAAVCIKEVYAFVAKQIAWVKARFSK